MFRSMTTSLLASRYSFCSWGPIHTAPPRLMECSWSVPNPGFCPASTQHSASTS